MDVTIRIRNIDQDRLDALTALINDVGLDCAVQVSQ